MRRNAARLEREWRPHIQENWQFIIDAAHGLTGKALVLGVGNATDIPLAHLANQFDELTLVEVDEESVVKAVEALPIQSQEKIHIKIEDLTGVSGNIAQRMIKASQRQKNFDLFVREADNIIRTTDPIDFREGTDYSFVCSSLVLSQLYQFPFDQMRYIASETYDRDDIRSSRYGNDVNLAFNGFMLKCQAKHFELLQRSIKPDGVIYFADTTSSASILDFNSFTGATFGDTVEMMHFDFVAEQIRTRFQYVKGRNWTWTNELPNYEIGGNGAGLLFQVEAFSLKPHKD